MKKLAACVISLGVAGSAIADQYHLEGFAGFTTGEALETIDYDSYAVGLTGYWNFMEEEGGVSLENGPYGESGFLSRASSITGIHAEADIGTRDVSIGEIRLVIGEGTIFEVAGSDNPDFYSVAIGSYWGENSASVVRLTRIETDADPVSGLDADPLLVEVDTHSVVSFGEQTAAFDLVLGWVTADEIKDGRAETGFSPLVEAGATFYPTENVGVGANFSWAEIQGIDTLSYNLSAEYFITPRLGIAGGFFYQKLGDGIGTANEAWSISVTGRL